MTWCFFQSLGHVWACGIYTHCRRLSMPLGMPQAHS